MSAEKAREDLRAKGFENRIETHERVIETVAHAAEVIGCTEGEIAKTLSFGVRMPPVLVVMAGDLRVSSPKFKARFGVKPYMLPRDEVEKTVGHAPGGVCPFGVDPGVPVYIDVSLKKYAVVHPAGGDEFTSVRLTPDELYAAAGAAGWCDVGKDGE